MNPWQEQIVIGTVLGGASLIKPSNGKNYYLSMRSKNKNWLLYKAVELESAFGMTLYEYDNSCRCNSSCSESLEELREKMYRDNKRVATMDILDCMRDISYAIWFLDGGGKTGRGHKNAYLNTTKFGEEGTQFIYEYFNRLGWDCKTGRNGNRRRILLSVKGTVSFFKVIAHRFPSFMYHRL